MFNESSELRRIAHQINNVGFRLSLNVFSVVLAPCVAATLFNPNCLKYYIPWSIPSPMMSTIQYIYPDSGTITNMIFAEEASMQGGVSAVLHYMGITEISIYKNYTPSYTYSYQCLQSLMNAYISVFVYFVMFGGVVFPLWQCFLRWLEGQCILTESISADEMWLCKKAFYPLLKCAGKMLEYMPSFVYRRVSSEKSIPRIVTVGSHDSESNEPHKRCTI